MNDFTKSQLWAIYDKVKIPSKLETEGEIQYVNWMDTFVIAQNPNAKTTLDISWEYITDDSGNDAWFFPDGTAEVKLHINVSGISHQASLPVMNTKHEAIVSPNSTEINKSKMRVRCKALGELGLFWRLWSDEYHNPHTSNVVALVPANEEVVLTESERLKIFMDAELKHLIDKPPLTQNGLEIKIKAVEKGLRNRSLKDSNFKRRMARWKKDLAPIMEAANAKR
jgi:hypothetical protein